MHNVLTITCIIIKNQSLHISPSCLLYHHLYIKKCNVSVYKKIVYTRLLITKLIELPLLLVCQGSLHFKKNVKKKFT